MIELDTPEGREQLREYYESIGLRVTVGEVYFVAPKEDKKAQQPEERAKT